MGFEFRLLDCPYFLGGLANGVGQSIFTANLSTLGRRKAFNLRPSLLPSLWRWLGCSATSMEALHVRILRKNLIGLGEHSTRLKFVV